MIDISSLKKHYDQTGFVLIESLFETSEIQKLQQASDALIEESKSYRESDERFDLEPDHQGFKGSKFPISSIKLLRIW